MFDSHLQLPGGTRLPAFMACQTNLKFYYKQFRKSCSLESSVRKIIRWHFANNRYRVSPSNRTRNWIRVKGRPMSYINSHSKVIKRRFHNVDSRVDFQLTLCAVLFASEVFGSNIVVSSFAHSIIRLWKHFWLRNWPESWCENWLRKSRWLIYIFELPNEQSRAFKLRLGWQSITFENGDVNINKGSFAGPTSTRLSFAISQPSRM